MRLKSVTLLCVFSCLVPLASLSKSQTRDSRSEQHLDTTKGISLFEAGDTAAAIATLLNEVKAHPDDAEAWHYLGRSYNRLGKNEEAIAAFQHAVKLKPTFSDSRVGLALALQRANRSSEASRESEAGLKENPNCDGCHYVLGLIALKRADQYETWRHAALALKMNPAFSAARDLRNQALVNAYSQVLSVKLKINEVQHRELF
jgi:Tfp pilus assembly protein PilF